MSPVKIVRNNAEIKALLKSQQVQDLLEERAQQIAQDATDRSVKAGAQGPEFRPTVIVGKNRARASVLTANREARLASAVENVLVQALRNRR